MSARGRSPDDPVNSLYRVASPKEKKLMQNNIKAIEKLQPTLINSRPGSAPAKRSPVPPRPQTARPKSGSSPRKTVQRPQSARGPAWRSPSAPPGAGPSETVQRPKSAHGRPSTAAPKINARAQSGASSPDEYEQYMKRMEGKVLAPTSYFFETPAATKRLKKKNKHHPRTNLGRYTCYERQRDRGFLYPGGKEPEVPHSVTNRPVKAKPPGDLVVRADGTVVVAPVQGIPKVGVAQALQILTQKAQDQCTEVGRFFRMYDKDKSGAIDYNELRAMLLNFNIQLTDDHYQKLVRHIDPDLSGEIGYDEFLDFFGAAIQGKESGGIGDQIMDNAQKTKDGKHSKRVEARNPGLVDAERAIKIVKQKMENQFAEVGRAFRSFDTDHSGAVSIQEFRRLLERYCIYLEDHEFRKVWAEFNPDGSGDIEYDEFVEYFGNAKTEGGVGAALQNSAGEKLKGEQDVFEEHVRYRPKPKVQTVEVKFEKAKQAVAKKEEVKVSTGPTMEDAAMQMRENLRVDLKRFRETFHNYDRNASHQNKPEDFKRVMAEYGIRLDEWNWERLMDRIDPSKKGFVDYKAACDFFKAAEFMDDAQVADMMARQAIAFNNPNRTPTPRTARPLSAGNNMANLTLEQVEARLQRKFLQAYGDIRAAFKASDTDSSGAIGFGEMRRILTRFCFKMEEKMFRQLVKKFDSNNDGVIQYDEFVNYFTNLEAGSVSVPSSRPATARERGPAKKAAAVNRAERFATHRTMMAKVANDELRVRIRKKMPAAASAVLRACAFADKGRTGYVHRAEFKVVFETYLFPIPSDQYLRLIKAFEAAGGTNRVNYKALVAQYR